MVCVCDRCPQAIVETGLVGEPLAELLCRTVEPMLGWSIIASACRSCSKRASTAFESFPVLINLSATIYVNEKREPDDRRKKGGPPGPRHSPTSVTWPRRPRPFLPCRRKSRRRGRALSPAAAADTACRKGHNVKLTRVSDARRARLDLVHLATRS